jgi:hypothetical protein
MSTARSSQLGLAVVVAAALLWLGGIGIARVEAEGRVYRLIVLQLDSENVDDSVARKLTERLQSELRRRPGFELVESPVSLAQLSLGQGCDSGEADCLVRIAEHLNVDGLLFGTLSRDGDVEQARVQHFDLAERALKGSALVTIAPDLDDVGLTRLARELIDVLFQTAPLGSHVAAGELSPQRAALARPSAVAATAPSLAADNSRKVAGYALLGGAVLSAGLSVLSFVEIDHAQSNDAFDRYRRAVGQQRPSVRDVCDEALSQQSYGLDPGSFQRVRSSCATGRTFEVLQFLFIGGAVISGGLSAFLLLGPGSEQPATDKRETSHFSLHPSLSRRGATLKARLTF